MNQSESESEKPHVYAGRHGGRIIIFLNSLDQILLPIGRMNEEVKIFQMTYAERREVKVVKTSSQ